jgi:hypothetical protein
MKKVLTIQEILDENTRIETITDKETLKKVLGAIIGVTSYSKVKRDDIIDSIEDTCEEFNIKL